MNRRSVPVEVQVERCAADAADEISLTAWYERRTEWGGLVWGRVYNSAAGPVVWVAAMTPGVGRASATVFEMAPESFTVGKSMLRAAGFPDGLDELGLWHSHPGLGAFLSAVDAEYFKICFPRPDAISIVIDPLHWERAIFVKSPLGTQTVQGYIDDGRRFGDVPELDPRAVWQQACEEQEVGT